MAVFFNGDILIVFDFYQSYFGEVYLNLSKSIELYAAGVPCPYTVASVKIPLVSSFLYVSYE